MISARIIEMMFKVFISLLFFGGLWLLIRDEFYFKAVVHRMLSNKWIMRNRSVKINEKNHYATSFARQLDVFLQATWRWYTPKTLERFVVFSISIFVAFFITLVRSINSWPTAFLSSLMAALFPYLILALFLHKTRSVASHHLTNTIATLLANYRSCNQDIYFALLNTLRMIDNITIKKALLELTKKIQNHNSDSEVDKAVQLFVYKIQTSWAKQLGVLILNAVIDGRNIEEGLKNIAGDMKEGQKIIAQEKSGNHDTILLGYLPAAAFPLTIFFMQVMSGKFDILHFQFSTKPGLSSFTITSIICLLGFVLTSFLRQPKNDL